MLSLNFLYQHSDADLYLRGKGWRFLFLAHYHVLSSHCIKLWISYRWGRTLCFHRELSKLIPSFQRAKCHAEGPDVLVGCSSVALPSLAHQPQQPLCLFAFGSGEETPSLLTWVYHPCSFYPAKQSSPGIWIPLTVI